jgi:hypothetical protein
MQVNTSNAGEDLRQTREYEHAPGPRDGLSYQESYPPEHTELLEDPADFDFLNHMEDFHSFRESSRKALL